MWRLLDNLVNGLNGDLPVRRFLLWGPPGTGKTTFGHKLASKLGRELFTITLTGDSMVQEILGHWVPKGSEFFWVDGPAVKAWRRGGVLVLNEIDQAAGPVLTALYAILDDPRVARLDLPNGETIRPHQGFVAIATTNTDPEVLPPALRDRFEVIVNIREPHPEALEQLPLPLRRPVIEAYRAFARGADRLVITYREAAAFARLASVVDEESAASLVWGERGLDILNAIKLGVRTQGGDHGA